MTSLFEHEKGFIGSGDNQTGRHINSRLW